MEYLSGKRSQTYLVKKYDIGCKAQLQRWIAAYQTFGDEGLLGSRQKEQYSFEFKLHVVEYIYQTKSHIRSWHYHKG